MMIVDASFLPPLMRYFVPMGRELYPLPSNRGQRVSRFPRLILSPSLCLSLSPRRFVFSKGNHRETGTRGEERGGGRGTHARVQWV